MFVGCCEAPLLPLSVCPAGFVGPDSAGQCYSLASGGAGGLTWPAARDACRAKGGDAQLAYIIDAGTQRSVIGPSGKCFNQATRSFWTGLGDAVGGTNVKTSPNLRWMASGHHSTYLQNSAVASAVFEPTQPDGGSPGQFFFVSAVGMGGYALNSWTVSWASHVLLMMCFQ